MLCIYMDLRDSSIFHPLFILKAQSKILHNFVEVIHCFVCFFLYKKCQTKKLKNTPNDPKIERLHLSYKVIFLVANVIHSIRLNAIWVKYHLVAINPSGI